jgi:hypothetical protein
MGLAPEHRLGNLPKISEQNIGNGLKGNLQTISFMKKVARKSSAEPLIRKLALNILHDYQVQSMDHINEAKAIGDYVKNKVRYVRDPDGIEYLQDPKDLVKHIQQGIAQGDCDDMALLTASLLLSVGHRPLFRAVRYYEPVGNYNHIYVVVYEKNIYSASPKEQRIVLDCILKNKPIGFETPHTTGEEYEI